MKIEKNNLTPLSTQKPSEAHPLDKSSSRGETTALSGDHDKAVLSEKARLLAKAKAALNEDSGVNQERVDQLKKQIDDGNYTVPLEELAKRMLSRLTPPKE
jgi:flagellar biosynthesis anti-sigma factor FlgM